MRIYLLSDTQIQKLYDSGSVGSRDFERVIETVKLNQEIKLSGSGTYHILKHEKTIQNIGGDQGDQPGQAKTVSGKKAKGSKGAGI